MSKRIYVDTNVYLDLFLGRQSKYRDFAAEAARLFKRAKDCEFEIVVSDLVAEETRKGFPHLIVEFESICLFLGIKLVRISTSPQDRKLSHSVSTHYADALHIVLAVRSGAEIIVTRNVNDFIEGPLPVLAPESI